MALDSPLAQWLRAQLDKRGLTQNQVAVYAGVSAATLTDILRNGHIPKAETLCRLADYFDASRIDVFVLAGHLQRADQLPGAPEPGHDDGDLTWQLLHHFRRIPDEWKPDAVDQIQWIARLAKRPPYRIIGDEPDEPQP
jgi:transcriptional regulator with XRE-family HTH domain